MSRLLPVAEQLLMMGTMAAVPQRKTDRTGQIIFGFAAILGVVSVIYLIFALSYWMKIRYEPDVAALVTAGVTLSLALLIASIGYAYNTIRKSKINAVGDEVKAKLMHTFENMADELEDPIRSYPKTSIAVASLAGYLLANRL